MRIPILILCNECKENVRYQYPRLSIEELASWMAFLCEHIYNEQ